MNQLMELRQQSNGTLTSDQSELLARMRNTIGIAVLAMESHKKSGIIWCPQSETDVENQNQTIQVVMIKEGELALGCQKLTTLLKKC
jgi:hypothetical protein